MAQLGIPIRDSVFFDVATYKEIIEIHEECVNPDKPRKATQSDIDAFLQ